MYNIDVLLVPHLVDVCPMYRGWPLPLAQIWIKPGGFKCMSSPFLSTIPVCLSVCSMELLLKEVTETFLYFMYASLIQKVIHLYDPRTHQMDREKTKKHVFRSCRCQFVSITDARWTSVCMLCNLALHIRCVEGTRKQMGRAGATVMNHGVRLWQCHSLTCRIKTLPPGIKSWAFPSSSEFKRRSKWPWLTSGCYVWPCQPSWLLGIAVHTLHSIRQPDKWDYLDIYPCATAKLSLIVF